jgi:putative PIN family toxin of toxin-antitoxin system
MPATVVFDTNILFSAVGWRGNPFRSVELARAGQIRAVACSVIMEELIEKLVAKLNFTPDQAADTLADYLAFIPLVPILGILQAVPRDPEDNAVLECAIAGQASFIITGDLDLLTLGTFQGVEIVRAAEFLRRWEAGEVRA